ncbi:LolA family protein [Myxococcus landrumensis]|uniref:Outer membrane lipoprotein carrier protein LolA n=1 Tax=Myxococcus landrumensis TaxID=2813577 RepID=A0ABX7NDD7_9BACT|nr:outer membrane lipoprotein carrier protein LolA [Myxococcus landrumus]QSQ16374.1 outer membrane lipoprotein carrier protein LolA [Myxococcus landrumus]
MRRVLLLVTMLVGMTASAQDVVTQVRARLADVPLLRGGFEQKKTVSGFKKPLVSRGVFLLAREQGVLWDTQTPFASTLTLTRKSLSAQQGSGAAAYHLDASKEPGLAAVNEVMFALLSGDVAALSKRFRVEGSLEGAEGWKLTLTPTDAGLVRVFRVIHLEGDKYVRQVRLEEARGDVSVIQFDKLAQTPSPTETEAQRLAK